MIRNYAKQRFKEAVISFFCILRKLQIKLNNYQKIYSIPHHPKSPLNPWAFIRVCDESQTLQQSLQSIVGAISRGIIVYNSCTDESEKIIKDFCSKNKGFKHVHFPYKIAQCKCTYEEFQNQKTLADYYNFALSFIPKGEWLIKIDADQIYDSNKLKESFKLIKSPRDIVHYFRINLHCFENRIYINKNIPISDPRDHWLILNHKLSFKNYIVNREKDRLYYWETLVMPFYHIWIDSPLSTWHFPLIKKRREELAKIKNHILLSEYKNVIEHQYLKRIDSAMLDERRILSLLKKANPSN